MSERKTGTTGNGEATTRHRGRKIGSGVLCALGIGAGVAIVLTGAVAAGYEVISAFNSSPIPADAVGDLVRGWSPGNGAVGFAANAAQAITTPLEMVSQALPNGTVAEELSETVVELAAATGAVAMGAGGGKLVAASVIG